jgi:tetratricopeptide (TPR) repeat protein
MYVELYPDDPTPHNNLGWYYQQLGNYEKAVEQYKMALNINPYLMLTYGGLNWTYLQYLAEPDSALLWSKKMVLYDDQNWWGYLYLGSSFLGKDSLERAEQAFTKAAELNPDFIFSHYRLAHVYRIQGRYLEAIKILEKILKIDENEISAHYDLGLNYQKINNREKARFHLTKFRKVAEKDISDNPDQAANYISLGVVLSRLGDKKLAWDAGKKGIELDSTMHFKAAEFFSVQGNIDEALIQLEKAFQNGYRDIVWLKIDPDLELLKGNKKYHELLKQYISIK